MLVITLYKREIEVAEYLLDREKKTLKKLEELYADALDEIKLRIAAMQTNAMTTSRAQRVQYQKTLALQITAILEKLHADEYQTIEHFANECYTNAFVGAVYNLHGQKIPMLLPIDNNAVAKAVLTESKINQNLYKELGVDVNHLIKTISNELARGISSNRPYAEIARNISFATGAPLKRAKTIVRTEAHRIQQASQDDARQHAKSRGANLVKQWDSTLDGRTRHTHRLLDGQIREINEPFTVGKKKAMYPGAFGDPAEDCNCRCVALTRPRAAMDEAELKTMQERAAYFKLDKTENFEEFKKKYLDAIKEN